jgi:hypothetical protein
MQKELLPGDVMAAQNTTTHNVEVTDNGSTANVIKNIESLVKSLKAAERQAKATMSAQEPGGTAGSRGVAQGMMSGSAYGISRATGAGTGAAARDFAKESQGLSGLVRLYAFYAANLFAVEAAFRALSKAADITNMVQGLSQLSAQSGVSLANVSKNLVTATGDAISFQEAMKTTAQVTAAGLGSGTVEKIGKAAKGISAALGVDASDAVSRLSRGITKIEPELLDELGIFVKIEDATRAYALSIGKAAGSLTDFERRQAFATAVLKEFETKFGGIELDANPFNKLAASLSNLATAAGELINKGLGPLITVLASSPTALAGIMILLASTIIQKVFPAISQVREGLKATAEDSAKLFEEKAKRAVDAQKKENINLAKLAEQRAEAEVDALNKAEANYKALKAKNRFGKEEKVINKVLGAESVQDVSAKDLAQLKLSTEQYERNGDVRAKVYREVLTAVERGKKAEEAYTKQIQKSTEAQSLYNRVFGARAQLEAAAAVQKEKATTLNIISDAAEYGGVQGLIQSFGELNKAIGESKLGIIGKVFAYVGGTIAFVGSRILTLIAALGSLFNWFTVVGGVLLLLDGFLRTNTKEMDELSKSMDSLQESTKTAASVLKKFGDYDPLNKFTVESLKARSNALNEIADGIKKVETDFKMANKSAGEYDQFREAILGIFDMDMKSNISETVGKTISQGILLADPGPARDAYKQALSQVLGISENFSAANIELKLKESGDFQGTLERITEVTKKFAQEQQAAAARISETTEAFKAADKAYKELAQSLSNQTPLEKFATNLQTSALKLIQALNKPGEAFQSLVEIIKDTNKLTILPKEQFLALSYRKKEIEELGAAADKARKDFQKFEAQSMDTDLSPAKRAEAKFKAANAAEDLKQAEEKGAAIAKPILQAIAIDRFKEAGQILGNEIKLAQVQAAIGVKKALASAVLTGPRLAQEEGRLTELDIKAKMEVIATTRDLILSNYQLKLSNQELAQKLTLENPNATPQEKATARTALGSLAVQRNILSNKNPLAAQQALLANENLGQEAKAAAGELAPILQMLGDATKQMMALDSQFQQNKISTFAKTVAAATQESMKYMENQEKILQGQLDEINNEEKLVAVLTDQDFIKKQSLERDILAERQAKERLTLQSRFGIIDKLAPGTSAMAKKLDTSEKRKGLSKEQLSYLEEYDAAVRDRGQQETQQAQELAALNRKISEESFTRELKIIDIKYAKETAVFELRARQQNFLLSIDLKARALEIEGLTLRKDLASITQGEYILEKAILETKQLQSTYTQQVNEINQKTTREVSAQQKIIDEVNAKQKAGLSLSDQDWNNRQNAYAVQKQSTDEQSESLKLAKTELTVKTATVTKTADLAGKIERINKLALQTQRVNDLSYQRYKLTADAAQLQINYQNQYLEGRKAVGLILGSEYALEKGINEQKQLSLTQSTKLSEINKTELDNTRALRAELDSLNAARLVAGDVVSPEAQQEYESRKTDVEGKLQLETDKAAQARAGLEKEIALQKLLNQLKTEQDVLQEKQLERMGKLVDATSSLAAIFGKVGEAIGKSVEQTQDFADKNTKLETQRNADIKLAEKRWETEADGALGLSQQKKEIDAKYNKDQAKLDASATLGQIGNVKKLFKEKTAAYKLMSAIETAIHVAKLIQMATEMSLESVMTSKSIIGSMARAGAKGLEAITSAYKMEPQPLGFIAGAAMTTIIAGILGAAFKGSSTSTAANFQMNTEQRQETGGTGSTYIPDPNNPTQGKLVETAGGVFGDSSAKVDSIRKGIEIIAATSVEGLDYDNKMLKSLNRLSDAMTGAAEAIYTIPGLRQGTGSFGTQPGTTKGGSSGIVGTIFGGKTSTTTSIQSLGIQLQGTFQQLIDDTAGSIQQYKDVLYQFHKSGGWFSKSRDWQEVKRETEALGADVRTAISDIFKESKTLFETIGEKSGVTVQQVQDAFNKNPIDISIDFTKLTGEEAINELNANIAKELNIVAEELFSGYKQYKKFGESLLETVVRVTDTNTKINQALVNIRGGGDSSINEFSEQFTEALAAIAGGLDVFLDRTDYFRENFLSKAEQLVPVQNAVDKEMTRLGFSTVKTTQDFKYLIQNFRITDQASMQTYVALLNVAEGFQKVYGAGKTLVEIEDERLSLQEKVIELTSTTAQLREKEISKLNTINQVYQRQINAITDYQTAAKAYQSSLQNTTKTLTSQITTLNDYKSGLMTGANTTLTATEQYATAKSEVESLVKTIKTGTQAEKDIAFGKLTGATDRFLGLSKQLYASGAQYSVDFQTVLSTVDEVTTSLGTQKTAAELQLSELESSNNFLQSIDESSKTTAELLTRLNTARTVMNTANTAATTASATSVASSANTSLFNNTQVAGGTAVTQAVHAGGWILDPVAGWVYVSDVSYNSVQTAIDSARAVITTGVAAAGTASAGAISLAGAANATAITTAGNTLDNTINGLPPIIATNNQNMVDALGKKFDDAIDRLIDAVDNNTEATVVVTTQTGQATIAATTQAAATQANTIRNTTTAYATMKRGESSGTTEL